MFRSRLIWLLPLVLCVAPFALAADQDETGDTARRAEAIQRLELVRLYRLTELLELNSDEASRLFPLFQKYDRKFRDIIEQKERVFADIAAEVRAEEPDAEKLSGLNDRIVELERQSIDIRNAQFAELKKNLTPVQLGKYLLFEKKFQSEMNRLLDDVRQRRRVKTATP